MEKTTIRVNHIATEYQLDDSCPLDESWEFNCQHLETHEEETMSVYPDHNGNPVERQGEPVEVCDNCYEVVNE